MNKKLLLTYSLFFVVFVTYGQTIVSTNPGNKKAILEEFTGINCVFCPQGHAIANNIKNSLQDEFFVINIHQGGFANPSPGQPDFRTPFGNAIVAQSHMGPGFGYPSGTVNRQNFPGREMTNSGTTAMARNQWAVTSNQVVGESAYVNVGVEAVIDVNTNVLTVHVEAYYTGNSPQSTNKLNVALLQNKTLGPQIGGNMEDEYVHMHRLVHLLTGQWGVDINNTSQGSFIDETFTYTIPDNYNGVSADIYEAEFEVVAFITETQQNIINGDGAYATYSGLPHANDATVKSLKEFDAPCDGEIAPSIQIQNLGTEPLTSLEISYSVNGASPSVYNWTGNLNPLFSEEVELPAINFEVQASNELVVSIPEDDNSSNNEIAYNFDLVEFDSNQYQLTIVLDNYPEETTWNIVNSAGAILASGGPYNNQVGQTIEQSITLADEDCYTFTIFDAFGDGICCQWGNGSYLLETQDGQTVVSGGSFGSFESTSFRNFETLSAPEFEVFNFSMYPNPSTGTLNLSANENFTYELYSLQGKKMLSGQATASFSNQVDLSNFSSGVYLVKININGVSETQKLIVK